MHVRCARLNTVFTNFRFRFLAEVSVCIVCRSRAERVRGIGLEVATPYRVSVVATNRVIIFTIMARLRAVMADHNRVQAIKRS